MPRVGSLAIVATCALMLAVVPLADAQPAAGTDQVIIGISQEPDTLNPLFAQRAASAAVMAAIFTADVQRDQRGVPFPQGVRSLPSVKDGTWKLDGERMVLLWSIRPRNWSDGAPVTCADYTFSQTVGRDPRVPIAIRDLTNRIAGVTCPDGLQGLTVRVEWKERYAYANLLITEYGALPRHTLESAYLKNPERMRDTPYGQTPETTVGDGAYRLVEWRRGSSLAVESAGPHPIFGMPRIRRITWQFTPDTRTLVTRMLSGAIDVISTIGISFEQALQLDRQSAGRFTVFFEPGLTWEHVDFNLDHPLLKDARVRRAIAYGLNRQQIVGLFARKQPVSDTYLPPAHPGYTDAVTKYTYDPARARALLRSAGFTLGPDGILRTGAGQRLSLELSTATGNRIREQVERIIQQNLREIGVEVTIRNFPARQFFGEITARRKFKALAMYAWVYSPTADCDMLYTSDSIPEEGNGWTGQNYPGYRNAEMDKVCAAAGREVDEAGRLRFLRESARIFSRDLPSLPLYVRATVVVARRGLRHVLPVQLGNTYETWNISQWSWESR